MRKQIVNGKVFDWSSVTIGITGCDGIEPLEISYDDEQEKEMVYGKGGEPRGWGGGNKKNSVKMSLLREDFNLLNDCMSAQGGFYKGMIPKITVSYADAGATTVTDVLSLVTFTKRSGKAAQGDKSLKVDLEGMAVGGIKWDGKE